MITSVLNIKYTILVVLSATLTTACTRMETNIHSGTNLCLTIKHHQDVVEGLEIYIKLEEGEFPGYIETVYDETLSDGENDGVLCIKDLVFGSYWVMAKGYDVDWGADVQGAMQLELGKFNPLLDTIVLVNEF